MDEAHAISISTVYLEQFEVSVVVVNSALFGHAYMVRSIAQALGMSHSSQGEKLRGDERFAGFLETVTVPTSGGPQQALCIHRKAIPMWLASIAPKRITNDKVRGKVTEFQQALWAAADGLWWGVQTVAPGREVAKPAHGTLTMTCLRCGTPHRLTVGEQRAMWEIDR